MLMKQLETAGRKPYVGPEAGMEHEYDFLPNAMKEMCKSIMDDKEGAVKNEVKSELREKIIGAVDTFNAEQQKAAINENTAKV